MATMRYLLIAVMFVCSGAWLEACPNCGGHRAPVDAQHAEQEKKEGEKDGKEEGKKDGEKDREKEAKKLTDEEVEKRLNRTISVSWDGIELKDAAAQVSAAIKVDIEFAEGVFDDDFVTAEVQDMKAGEVLKSVLGFLDLTYKVKDGKIVIIEAEKDADEDAED
jgi:hypothetical protein